MADPVRLDVRHHPHQVPQLATAARSIMTGLRGWWSGSGRATLVRVAAPPAAVAAGNDASANAANAISWASQHGGQDHQLATTAENHASSCCG